MDLEAMVQAAAVSESISCLRKTTCLSVPTAWHIHLRKRRETLLNRQKEQGRSNNCSRVKCYSQYRSILDKWGWKYAVSTCMACKLFRTLLDRLIVPLDVIENKVKAARNWPIIALISRTWPWVFVERACSFVRVWCVIWTAIGSVIGVNVRWWVTHCGRRSLGWPCF